MNLKEIGEEANKTAREHGFWDEDRNVGEQISLMHSELSEALEEYRKGIPLDRVYYRPSDGKPEGFGVELADCIIRICDTAQNYKIDLDAVLREKMDFNKSRPYKHGKVC